MNAAADWPYPRWVAHRGAGKFVPENTLAAFRYGAEHGFRMFECDAKLSADGVVFLLHDATLDRTTDGTGVAGELPWHDLAQLDAGGWHSRAYAGEALCTLDNLMRFCLANRYFLNIEIKPTPGQERVTGEKVARAVKRMWTAEVPPFLTSFQPDSLAGAMSVAPQVPRGLLLDSLHPQWVQAAQQLRCRAVVLNYALWNEATVAEAKAAGLRTLSYTVNDEWVAERLLALGTDGIITDRVDLFSPV